MPKRLLPGADALAVLLLWLPVGAVALGLMLGWSPGALLSAAGLTALPATWVLIFQIGRPREQAIREVREEARGVWRALGMAEPTVERPDDEHELIASARSLRLARRELDARIGRSSLETANLRATLDAAPSPIIVTDGSGTVVLCNREATDFFGREQSQVVGKSIEELFPQAQVLGQHAAALRGEMRVGQIRVQGTDGLKIYQMITAPVGLRLELVEGAAEGGLETGVVVTARDVTELAQAVQLKTDFVANASHELRTPLSSIKVATDTLRDGGWDEPAMRERLGQMIAGNVSRLEEMIRDLLDLSRLESTETPPLLESVELMPLLAGLRETFDGVLRERKLMLEYDVAGGCEVLRTDAKLLTLILRNLIDNATKYGYEGTVVRLEARVVAGESGKLGVRFSVTDRGIGIPLAQQHRIFERFYQVDPSRTGTTARRGTGLGLAIVKHAVKTLGGTIGVESVWKQGTTMTVEIPESVA